MKIKKISMLLLTISLSASLLMGCQNASSNTNNSNTKTTSSRQKPYNSKMKANFSATLKTLVSNATITQDQSDKILSTLTSNKQNNRSKGRTHSKGSGFSKSNGESFNPLNSLVQSGTITKDQASTVWNELKKSMPSPKNSGNNNGQ